MSLFRSEVVAERTAPSWGAVVVSQAPALKWASLALVLAAGAGLAAVLSLEYARKVRVSGYLEPRAGIAEVTAPASGRIAALKVGEEEQVRAGQVLAVLDHDRHSEQGRQVHLQEASYLRTSLRRLEQRALADAEKLNSERRSLQEELDHLTGEQAALQEELALASEQKTLLRLAEERLFKLMREGLAASASYEQGRQRTLAAAQGEIQIERTLAANARQTAQAREALVRIDREREARQLAADQERADLSRQLARLGEQRQTAVVAPMNGVVTFMQFGVGDHVAAEWVLMTVTPDDSTIDLVLLAGANAATDMAVGDEVRFKALSGHRRRNPIGAAVVRELSQTPQKPHQLRSWVAVNGPVFRARAEVAKFPDDFPKRSGMQVDAFVVTKSRTLWRWLLTPLLDALEGL